MSLNLGYREFFRQIEMLTEYEKMSPEDKQKYVLLACDLDIDGKSKKNPASKKYAMIQYHLLFPFISRLSRPERCYNELIKINTMCRQHFDLDAPYTEDNKVKIEFIKSNFHSDFIQFWDDLNTQNEFGCKVLLNRYPDKRNVIPVTMNTYSASTDYKFSWHVIFPEIVMQNSFHCGALMRRLELWIINKYGDDITKNPYYMQEKDESNDLIIDRSIYTKHRVFRLPFNTKAGQNRHFKPHLQSKFNIETKEITTKEMIITITPDIIMLESFLQYLPDYNSFDFFSCCEARSYLVYESTSGGSVDDDHSMFQTNERFEWIEPYTMGDRVITMSTNRLKKMNMTQFINGSISTNINGKRSPEVSLSSSSSSSFMGYSNFLMAEDSISLDDIMREHELGTDAEKISNIKNELKRRKHEVLMESVMHSKMTNFDAFKERSVDKNRDKKIVKSYKSLIQASQRYFMERCYPNWLNNKIEASFIDLNIERTVNIEFGTIHIYPKNVKRCQFKGFSEHAGNHVYFIIHCNATIGNVGFYQKCHSYHHTGPMVSRINEPFRNDVEEKLFKDVQKKLKKYTTNITNMMYPQILCMEEYVSSWIFISIFNTIFAHFMRSISVNLFSLFNQVSNTEMIFKSIEKLNTIMVYYIDMIDKKKIDHHLFIGIVDSIMAKAIRKIENQKIRKYYIKKYSIYRSNLIVFSLSNMFSTNNFNHLVEKMFVEVLNANNVNLMLLEGTKFDKKINNSMLHIHRLAAITEKKIIDKYKKYKNNEMIEEKDTLNLDMFIEKSSSHVAKTLDLNYNNLEY